MHAQHGHTCVHGDDVAVCHDIDKLLSLCGEYIDNDFEKYKFEWKGKIEALKLAQKRSTGTLRPCKAESVNFDETKNLYIEGDNLEVLKLLQTAYYNKIKMIYIDPPYNTGNDFVYEDDFADPMARYKEVTQQTTKSNAETMGRYHTNWLNMMYPRLRLAANLLTNDGAIFISIDDNEVTNLRKICDEIFGEENFVAQIVKVGNSAKNNVKQMSITHEYCVIYAKNMAELPIWQVVRTNASEFQKRARTLIKNGMSDEEVQKELRVLTKYPRFYDFDHYTYCDSKGVFRANDLTAPGSKNFFDILHPITNKPCKTGTRGWAYSPEGINELLEKDMIYFGKDETVMPQLKCYLEDTLYQAPRAILFFDSQTDTKWIKANNLGFDFPKPVEYIKHLASMIAKNDGDIILDFFSGSATTAHAVMQLCKEDNVNRKYICVQIPELTEEKSDAFNSGYINICEIGKERIRRAGKKILEETAQSELGDEEKSSLDVGFKVFKLDTSNLKTWDGTPIQDKQIDLFYERLNAMIDTVKDDRTDMDVVYEVMLKMGIPLDVEVQYMEINDKIAYIVGDFILMICLADKITAEDIEAMAQYAPAKIICAEAGFADDSALSNAHYILKDRAIELKLV